jgi:hypothetical protein
MPPEKDFYKILGVSRGAGAEDIKRAFRKLAMLYHPDKNPGNQEAAAFFREMREAYETLHDGEKRRRYDARVAFMDFAPAPELNHVFTASFDRETVRVNDEVRLSFTYTGEGRVFLRPPLDGFFLTGPPFVSFAKARLGGVDVKETTLTYIVAPLRTGPLTVGEASIRIDHKLYATRPLSIQVSPNRCYYSRRKPADGRPFKYRMHYEAVQGSDKQRTLKNVNHTVLIPRSHYAAVNHGIGRAIKLGSVLWGMALCLRIEVAVAWGLVGGLLFGGAACNLFYLVTGIRPRFYYSRRYPLVQGYLEKGYRSGPDTGSQFINSEWVHTVNGLVF